MTIEHNQTQKDETMNAHQLKIFAFHVHNLTTSPVGSMFTICWGTDLRVRVEIRTEHAVYFDGRYVGNRWGAADEYAKLVASEADLDDAGDTFAEDDEEECQHKFDRYGVCLHCGAEMTYYSDGGYL